MRTPLLILSLFVVAACGSPVPEVDELGELDAIDADLSEGKDDSGGIRSGTEDASTVMAVANHASLAQLRAAGLGRLAAGAIDAYRQGDSPAKSDDQEFCFIRDLDAVPYIGPVAFQRMLAYGRTHGFVQRLTDGRYLLRIDADGTVLGQRVGTVWYQALVLPVCETLSVDWVESLTEGSAGGTQEESRVDAFTPRSIDVTISAGSSPMALPVEATSLTLDKLGLHGKPISSTTACGEAEVTWGAKGVAATTRAAFTLRLWPEGTPRPTVLDTTCP